MTHGQFTRLRRWDRRTQPAYNAGVLDGMDLRFTGCPRPLDPDEGYDAPFDLRFVLRPSRRREQEIVNHNLARERGKVDGWDCADEQMRKADEEDWIEAQVLDGIAKFEGLLGQEA